MFSKWPKRAGAQSPTGDPDIGDPDIVGNNPIGNVDARILLVAVLIAHVCAWTVYGTVALGVGGIHGDMAEAWVWGQELQLGYFKHPPFWAWLTFAWFDIFPRANWSFYLLAALNAAAGLWGTWALAGLFLKDAERYAVILFLMLTPNYGFLALKFNANSILLSLWPWATFFFVRSLASRRTFDGVGLGLFAGLAMLSKYYTLLLLATFFLAALFSENRRRYFRSAAPYAAAATCAFVLLPPRVVDDREWKSFLRICGVKISVLLLAGFALDSRHGNSACCVLRRGCGRLIDRAQSQSVGGGAQDSRVGCDTGKLLDIHSDILALPAYARFWLCRAGKGFHELCDTDLLHVAYLDIDGSKATPD